MSEKGATMKGLVWTGPDRIEIRELPRPRPSPYEVLVKVSHVGICGTDLHIWRGQHPRATPPLVMGHEFSGVVAEPGQSVEGFTAGEGVVVYPVIGCGECSVCRTRGEYICGRLGLIGIDRDGGMAEYVAIPARKLHRLPPGADLAHAALIEPVAINLHTLSRCAFTSGATVAIIGAGPIGACIAIAAHAAGAGQVLVSDVSAFRLGVIRELGFRAVDAARDSLREAVLEATAGEGADFVFEATGIPRAARGVEQLAAIGGALVIVGIFPQPVPLDLRRIAFHELTLVGIRHYTPAEFDRAVADVASGRMDVAPLITDVYPLERAVEAFERSAAGADTQKLLIRAS